MKYLPVLSVFLVLTIATWARAAAPSDYAPLANALTQRIETSFYDPLFHGVDWPKLKARFLAQAAEVHSDEAFLRSADALLRDMKVSHLYVVPPSRSSASKLGFAINTIDIGKDRIVIDVPALSDAHRAGVRPGDRLIGPAVDSPTAPGLASLPIEGCDGVRRNVEIRRESGLWPPEHPGVRWQRLTPRKGVSIGYLRVDRFDDDSGAGLLFEKAMDELKDTQALVIDIRLNSGGDSTVVKLASYFIPGPPQLAVALLARPYLEALGHPVTRQDLMAMPRTEGAYSTEQVFHAVETGHGGAAFYTSEAGPRLYRGRVVVLTGADTGSSGDGFASIMKSAAHATLIGRRTAGKILSGEEFPLIDGWSVTVPVMGLWNANAEDIGDQPVYPTIEVPLDRQAICQGRDLDVERALDELGFGVASAH